MPFTYIVLTKNHCVAVHCLPTHTVFARQYYHTEYNDAHFIPAH